MSSIFVGKTHINTVPVKLCRVKNDLHKGHKDKYFCFASIRHVEELASILGPDEVLFLSQDDKARVPIGMAAAVKQSPLLMHLEYRVKLPDHNWVVANRHKLIPSVIAGIVIKPNGNGDPKAVTYSGPTFISIRSGKHSSSTAASHAKDLEDVILCPEFDPITKTKLNCLKAVYISTVDGGGDENPRYPKVVDWAIHMFVKYEFDVYIVITNAPHQSAFNRVERRMSPLSKELTGIILPHDHFGNHLDGERKTIDEQLELKNFRRAGEVLSEVWNKVVIDTYSTTARYIDPEDSECDFETMIRKDVAWQDRHIRRSQYFLQIVKCLDQTCCKPFKSSYLKVIPDRYLPLPVFLSQSENRLVSVELDTQVNSFCPSVLMKEEQLKSFLPTDLKDMYCNKLPYDLFCPTVKDHLSSRVCKICQSYFTSQLQLRDHMKVHKQAKEIADTKIKKIRPIRVAAKRANELLAIIALDEQQGEDCCEWIDEELVEPDFNIGMDENDDEYDLLPVCKLSDIMSCPWEEDI